MPGGHGDAAKADDSASRAQGSIARRRENEKQGRSSKQGSLSESKTFAKTNVTMAPIKALESMHLIQAGVERDGENMVKKIKGVIQFIIKGGDDGAWAATRR